MVDIAMQQKTFKSILGQSNPTSTAILKKSNQITEKWTKKTNFYLKVAPTWVLLPKLIVNYYVYIKTDSKKFGLPFPMW